MKKYNINNLYVVSIEKGDEVHRFICKYHEFSDTYVEIFTDEKIKASIEFVDPLTRYYAVEQYNSSLRKKMMVSKSDLLRKYIEINSEVNLEKEEKKDEIEDNPLIDTKGILEKATINFFPTNGSWGSNCFRRPTELLLSNLPSHLRDDYWLAQMLKKDQKLFFMSTRKVLDFVSNSPFFEQKRHEYELEIVKWQIEWMMNGGENWIVDEDYGGDFVFLTSNADLGFRKGVVDTLTRIGMDPEVVEEGIEKYSDMWRESFMRSAFRNEFEPVFVNFASYFDDEVEDREKNKRAPLEPAGEVHLDTWLKVRKYEYYQRHKDSVDKYGTVEPEMTLTEEEIATVKEALEEMNSARKELIDDYQNRGKGKRKMLES